MSNSANTILAIYHPGCLLGQMVPRLVAAGYRVESAHVAAEAARTAISQPVDIIVVGAAFDEQERLTMMRRVNPTGMIPMLMMRPHPLGQRGNVHPLNKPERMLVTIATLLEFSQGRGVAASG